MRTNPPAAVDPLRAHLANLKLSYLLEHFEALTQQASAEQWSHLDYLTRLIEGEAHRREDREGDERPDGVDPRLDHTKRLASGDRSAAPTHVHAERHAATGDRSQF